MPVPQIQNFKTETHLSAALSTLSRDVASRPSSLAPDTNHQLPGSETRALLPQRPMGDVALATPLQRARALRGFSTPARRELAAERTPDPEKMASFFRARSAHLDSPIFTHHRKLTSDYAKAPPQVRLCADWKERDHVPDEVDFDIVSSTDFTPGKGLHVPDADLGWCVARNPLAYAVRVVFDPMAAVTPVRARLSVKQKCNSHMFVLARPEMTAEEEDEICQLELAAAQSTDIQESDVIPDRWFWTHPRYSDNESDADDSHDINDLLLKFWAAPGMEYRRGCATLKLEIQDSASKTHTAEFTIRAKSIEPVLKVTGPGIDFDETSKSTKIVLYEDTEQQINIVNETPRNASILASVYLEEDGVFPMNREKNLPGAFVMSDLDGDEEWALGVVKLMKADEKISLVVNFQIPENTKTIPVCYHGYIVVRIAYFLCNKLYYDEDLPQYYDYVIYLEAPREDGVPDAYSPYTYAPSYMSRRTRPSGSIEPRSSRELTASEKEAFEEDAEQFPSNFPDSLYFGGDANEPSFFDANDFTATNANDLLDTAVEATAITQEPLGEPAEVPEVIDDEQSTEKWPTPFKSTPFKKDAVAFQETSYKDFDDVEQSYDFGLLWSDNPTSPQPNALFPESRTDIPQSMPLYETCDEDIASKWRPSPTDIQAPMPTEPAKLRMPRGIRTRGLSIAADCDHVILPLQNASPFPVEVRLRTSGHVTACIQQQIVHIDSGRKAKVRITRQSSTAGTAQVHATVSPLDADGAGSVHYRVTLNIAGATRRARPDRIALDRPTLTFYAPRLRSCVGSMRVLNGLGKETQVEARVRNVIATPSREAGAESPFAFDATPSALVRAGDVFNVSVKFTAEDHDSMETEAAHYSGQLDVLADGRRDTVPLFGYVGVSWIECTLETGGVVEARNDGERAGYLLVHEEGRVLMPGETISVSAPPEWDGIVTTGDEIARSRLRCAYEMGLLATDELNELYMYLLDFQGQEAAEITEALDWSADDELSLHYASRLFVAGLLTVQARDGAFDEVPVDEAERWGAYFDEHGRVRMYNSSPDIPLRFKVSGAVPASGVVPELGDGVLEECSEVVVIRARKRVVKLRRRT